MVKKYLPKKNLSKNKVGQEKFGDRSTLGGTKSLDSIIFWPKNLFVEIKFLLIKI